MAVAVCYNFITSKQDTDLIQIIPSYYHGQIDMEILLTGVSYDELPDTYVIFICDFDPFGEGKYRYTRKAICEEVPELQMDDGAHTIFLSTKGTNVDEVPEELVKLLKFIGANPSESEKDYEDAFIQRLQESVREVKVSREMGARYMTFQEMLKDEREAGREQELVELCQEFGKIKEETILKMMSRLHLNRKDAETRIEQYWK